MNPILAVNSNYSVDLISKLLIDMQQQEMEFAEKIVKTNVAAKVQAVSDGIRGQVLDIVV